MKKVKLFLRSIFIIILFFNSSIFQYLPILLLKLDITKLRGNDKAVVLLSTFSSIIMAIIILILYRKDIVKEFKTFKNNLLDNINIGLICWITGIMIMVIANGILVYVFKSDGANNENAIQSLIKACPYVMALDICLLAPFNEEFVFRKALKDISINKQQFVIMSFLLFGGAHVIGSAKNIIDLLYIIPYGSLGAAFAIAYNKTDTVYTSMSFHMLHNTMAFLLSIFIKI